MIGSTLHIAELPSCLLGLDQSTRLLHKEGYVTLYCNFKFYVFNKIIKKLFSLTGRPNRINSSSIVCSSVFNTSEYLTSVEVNQSALLLHSIHRRYLYSLL